MLPADLNPAGSNVCRQLTAEQRATVRRENAQVPSVLEKSFLSLLSGGIPVTGECRTPVPASPGAERHLPQGWG
jgi:hypothetical protein